MSSSAIPRRMLSARSRFSVTLGFPFQLALSPTSLPRRVDQEAFPMRMVMTKVVPVQAVAKVVQAQSHFPPAWQGASWDV